MKEEQAANNLSVLLNSDMWSNAACCGYALLACRSLKYTEREIKILLAALNAAFSDYTLDEAEIQYYKA